MFQVSPYTLQVLPALTQGLFASGDGIALAPCVGGG